MRLVSSTVDVDGHADYRHVRRLGVDEHRFRRVRYVREADTGATTRVEPWSIVFTDLDTGAILDVVDGRRGKTVTPRRRNTHHHGESGRARLPALGMYTRLTGRGRHDEAARCTCTANSILAWEVNATCPLTPAVLRQALRCVACRTLTRRVAPTAQHQLLQVPDRGQVPFLCRLEDPLP